MEIIINNEFVTAIISQQAAEVISFKDNAQNIETVWCRDEKFWFNCNPVLFPFVGPLTDNKFTYKGKEYTMTQHGFARRSKFELVQIKKDEVTLSLKSNEETLQKYPFRFELTVRYYLQGRRLNIQYTLRNDSEEELPFNIGFHPAFNCPNYDDEKYEQCYVEFEKEEKLSANVDGISLKDGDRLYLKEAVNEKKDSVFFLNGTIQSDTVTLHTPDYQLTVSKKGYDVLGFWRKNTAAPFICIEPQYPVNNLKKNRTFRNDSDNNLLPVNETFSCEYYWELGKAD